MITGVTGQDGSYLAELLLQKGYEVIGVVRRTSHDSYERIGHLLDRGRIVANGTPAELKARSDSGGSVLVAVRGVTRASPSPRNTESKKYRVQETSVASTTGS